MILEISSRQTMNTSVHTQTHIYIMYMGWLISMNTALGLLEIRIRYHTCFTQRARITKLNYLLIELCLKTRWNFLSVFSISAIGIILLTVVVVFRSKYTRLDLAQCGAVIVQSVFSKSSQGSPDGSPMRVRHGVSVLRRNLMHILPLWL